MALLVIFTILIMLHLQRDCMLKLPSTGGPQIARKFVPKFFRTIRNRTI